MVDVARAIDINEWSCPLPLRDYPKVVLGHGGGGLLSAELTDNLFVPAFANDTLRRLGDSALVDLGGFTAAFSTDSFVVKPLVFPGGNIGDLAINGTVNDLAMSGAVPLFLSAGFILEEGLDMALLGVIVETMAAAARRAGVTIVTGDTKVVEQGRGDGLYINTAGIGSVAPGVHVGPDLARSGDVVIVSGPIGLHGMAVLSVREGLEFGTTIESDCAPLNGVVASLLAAGGSGVHAMRDPTRGGVAATVNEIARASAVGVLLDESSIPVPADVAAACAMLGLDVLSVANEGKVVVFAAAEVADAVLDAMRHHDLATEAAVIGRVVDDHPGMVVARTGIGGRRVVDVPLGEQLPRIC